MLPRRLAKYCNGTSSLIQYITVYGLALHMTGVGYTVLPVYILYRYRFAQGTVVPGCLSAGPKLDARMHVIGPN